MRVRAMVLSGLAVLALGGCSSVVDGTASPGGGDRGIDPVDPAAAPAIGSCHDITDLYEPLQGLPAVDCTAPHTSETIAVMETGLGEDAPYPTEDDVTDGDLSDLVYEVCDYDDVDEYLGNEDYAPTWTNDQGVFPDEEAWEAGARWVSCELSYGYYDVEDAPGVMAGALDGPDAAAYRICLAGTLYDADQVPCSQEHVAELVGGFPDAEEEAPFPGDQAARKPYADACSGDAQDYLGGSVPEDHLVDVYIGSEDGWTSFPLPECVLVRADGSNGTGTARD